MRLRSFICAALLSGVFAPAAFAADGAASSSTPPPAVHPEESEWSFNGPFGTYDRAALQRGFHVYRQVCSACHGLKRVAFRTLGEPGGPGFSAAEVKAIAAAYQIPAGPNDRGETTDESGQPLMRAGIEADTFPRPFANDAAARSANNGALPPDLSIIVKAREGHENYIHALLTGFGKTPPEGFTVKEGLYYNPYFAGHQIAMAPPLVENSVTYADGTPATIEQMTRDVVTFLAWTAEPKMEERKRAGLGVMIFLFAFAVLLFSSYRKVWAEVH